MKWQTNLTKSTDLNVAVKELTIGIENAPDVIFLFSSLKNNEQLLQQLKNKYPSTQLIGSSTSGVIGHLEEEKEPGASLIAAFLPDVRVELFSVPGETTKKATDINWETVTKIPPELEPCFVLFLDPFTCNTKNILRSFDESYSKSSKIGGLASGSPYNSKTTLFINNKLQHGGLIGMGMYGDIQLKPIIAQGCRPIGTPMQITKSDKNIILELDNQPVLQMLQNLIKGLSGNELNRFRHNPMIGIDIGTTQHDKSKQYLIRDVLGISNSISALAIGEVVKAEQWIQFHIRDAQSAHKELKELLEKHNRPCGSLLFSCLGRGERFYQEKSHDTGLFLEKFPKTPIGGFFCNGELGPIKQKTFLHSYTSVFGLFYKKVWS